MPTPPGIEARQNVYRPQHLSETKVSMKDYRDLMLKEVLPIILRASDVRNRTRRSRQEMLS